MSEEASKNFTYEGEVFDRVLHATLGKYTGWFSPASLALAYTDWFSHLCISPAKQMDIYKKTFERAVHQFLHFFQYFYQNSDLTKFDCKPNDYRFRHELWKKIPFKLYAENFLLSEQFWDEATKNVRGVSTHHLRVINFIARQLLDIYSPSNIPWMNPEVITATIEQSGNNFIRGFHNFFEDCFRFVSNLPVVGSDEFKVGVDVAITPGKVVYRNRLIELIQYEPTTDKVYKEPILIVPAWIMKYYILDLSPHNSLVKYLVEQGHTVFMISWKNPDGEDRDLGLDAYINLGIMSALEVINKIIPDTKVNAVGYCIGGTLLMIAAAAMAGKSDDRLNSITLFAAQVDFKIAGELLLFIDESQITYLEDIMWEKGYLDGSQMAGAFSMLHSTKLIWSRFIREYLLGDREPLFDLMAWDYDTTRLPYRMHSEYLRKLFLNNDLVQGHYAVAGKNVALPDISVPIFVVSTVTDHVAPWKSVYKIHLFTKTDITFVLTSGGHNAGIVSEPGHPHRTYQLLTMSKGDKHITADTWQKRAPLYEGSWWIDWHQWLGRLSTDMVDVPAIGNTAAGYPVLCAAPGMYVLKK